MNGEALLRAMAEALRESRIPFMLTGSVASAYHGAGRATMDVDFVIDPDPVQLEVFLRRVAASGVYLSVEAAREALTHRTMFNVVDPESGWKADLIIRKGRAFSEGEFARRQPIEFFGVPVDVASLEDVVLSKLEWAKLGGSARQLDDVRALLALRRGEVDLAYVLPWVEALGLQKEWGAASAGRAQ
ncbi:MAG: hypothetical protein ACT4P7_01575 [Gemmatimonadaceae bacterium]